MVTKPLTKNIDMGRGPLDISGYQAVDGYQSTQVIAKGLSPQDALELVKTSGLKGRGGAGFPTGLK
ncbi:MAG: NADH-quinone oxidoreductase subunit F, partial [Pseudohongiellaceae bacterium]